MGREVSSAVILRTSGVLQMRTSALFGAKNFGFFEISGVSAWTRGKGDRASADIVRTKEEVSIFCDLVRKSFMDDSLGSCFCFDANYNAL